LALFLLESNLKEIFIKNPQLWRKIFGGYLTSELEPNFSLYRKALDHDHQQLQILYMKS